ncbi:MAG TPA: dihydrodipicolinate synthase family protein [Syntrophales bacterium]|nr:dihydrodipicolinate synthase family protein [Syntrophales bacterium]
MDTLSRQREALSKKLFPEGIPRLWCPLLTHYDGNGKIDLPRMRAHFAHVAPWVAGFLIPGTTGDGWELDDGETETVVRFALEEASNHDSRILLGALRHGTEDVLALMDKLFRLLENGPGEKDPLAVLTKSRVAGFTVCAPKGKDLDQETILRSLFSIADRGYPLALYQLPQVTENEIHPDTFDRLCLTFANIIFFKDSSGGDRIAAAARHREGIFLVRGAEGGYSQWLTEAGGPYDGFLLSTANCFAAELSAIIDATGRGDMLSALELSEIVTGVFEEVSGLVGGLPVGNAFTNANKAMDHFFALGPEASTAPGPMLHGGVRIPPEALEKTRESLNRFGLMPETGYLP